MPIPSTEDERLSQAFAGLKNAGFEPSLIYDVGANRGGWTRMAYGFYPNAEYILVEPQQGLHSSLADLQANGLKAEWVAAGAGDQEGEALFSLADRDDSYSFAPTAEQAKAWGLKQVSMPITTLDAVSAERGHRVPQMLKIDAEGFDLKVLDGAGQLTGKVEVLFIEASVCAPNVPNTVGEVVKRLDAAGYRVFDITHLNHNANTGRLWLVELAFCLKSSPLWNRFGSHV